MQAMCWETVTGPELADCRHAVARGVTQMDASVGSPAAAAPDPPATDRSGPTLRVDAASEHLAWPHWSGRRGASVAADVEPQRTPLLASRLPEIEVSAENSQLASIRPARLASESSPVPIAIRAGAGASPAIRPADSSMPRGASALRAWHWPAVIEQLILHHWPAVHHLGRSSLGNCRDARRHVLVTGVHRFDGCSTIALLLARWAAGSNQRALVIDANPSGPRLSRSVGVPVVLRRPADLAGDLAPYLVTCPNHEISLLPLADLIEPRASRQEHRDQLRQVLATAERDYDCVYIDAGTIASLNRCFGEAAAISSSIVVVNSARNFDPPAVLRACSSLWVNARPALVVVENLAPLERTERGEGCCRSRLGESCDGQERTAECSGEAE